MSTVRNKDIHTIPDVQSYLDTREIAIDEVGIKDLKYPIVFRDGETVQPTIANFYMAVSLPADRKGTHMSRFVRLLNDEVNEVSLSSISSLLKTMNETLNAEVGIIELEFPYFLTKHAPVSGLASKIDYSIHIEAKANAEAEQVFLSITVPVTSLCPCSKEVAAYSAHNQRSHIVITVDQQTSLSVEELIKIAEKQASSELYGLLKRSDEKFVTELAYDNPKFVEDMVRDVARELMDHDQVSGFIVETENFESIHNHSAYASIRHKL